MVVIPPPVVQVSSASTKTCPEPLPVPQYASAVPAAPVQPNACLEILQLEPLAGEIVGNSVLAQSILFDSIALSGNPHNLPEVEVRPVEIGNRANDSFNLLNLPVAAHLSRTQAAPIFSNKKEHWRSFVWKFDSWTRAIASGRVLGDSELLQLLISCLPLTLQKEIQFWE